MKKIIFILSLAIFISDISAQQDAQFSQNMFNKLANNPGFTGSNQAISVIGLFRDQWSGRLICTFLGVWRGPGVAQITGT